MFGVYRINAFTLNAGWHDQLGKENRKVGVNGVKEICWGIRSVWVLVFDIWLHWFFFTPSYFAGVFLSVKAAKEEKEEGGNRGYPLNFNFISFGFSQSNSVARNFFLNYFRTVISPKFGIFGLICLVSVFWVVGNRYIWCFLIWAVVSGDSCYWWKNEPVYSQVDSWFSNQQ